MLPRQAGFCLCLPFLLPENGRGLLVSHFFVDAWRAVQFADVRIRYIEAREPETFATAQAEVWKHVVSPVP